MNRLGSAVVVLLGLSWARAGQSADRMVLPPTEDPAAWRGALAMAGFDAGGVGPGDAVVQAERTGAVWTLRAVEPGGRVRTAVVAAPATAPEREEVAFLAQGLLRELAASVRSAAPPTMPRPGSVVALPPPPKPVARPPPQPGPVLASVAPDPDPAPPAEPAKPAAEVSPDGPPIVPEDLDLLGTAAPPDTFATPTEPPPPSADAPLVLPEQPPPAHPRHRPRWWEAQSTALWVGGGVAARPDTQPAGMVEVGWELARIRRASVGVDLAYQGPHALPMALERSESAWSGVASVAIPLVGSFAVAPELGLSYCQYNQQQTPIDQLFVPTAGARLEVGVIQLWRLHLVPVARGSVDLARTSLVNAAGRPRTSSPFEAGFTIRVRFDGSGDPFGAGRTSIE